jgi:hypothetical protein
MRHLEKAGRILTYLLNLTLLFGFTTTVALSSGTTERKLVFNIKSKLYVDGKLVSSPKIIARANQKASIDFSEQNKSLKMELIACDEPKIDRGEPIKINFDIVYKFDNENMHSKSKIVVLPNQLVKVKFKSESGHNYKLEVIAERA